MTSPTIPDKPRISAAACVRHQFEVAFDRCRTCDGTYCVECLIYALGPDQPPFCMNCALVAAGVRKRGARAPKVSRRELRRREKEAQAAARASAVPVAPIPEVEVPVGGAGASEPGPELSWLDAQPQEERAGRLAPF